MYRWFSVVFLLLYHTSVAVSIVQRCAVVSSSVRCDGADAQQAPSAFRASPRHRVADAAIRQPARGAAVQAGLPGQIHLPHCGQLPPEGHAAVWGWGQRQSAWDGGVKHLTWRRRRRRRRTRRRQILSKRTLGFNTDWWYCVCYSQQMCASLSTF